MEDLEFNQEKFQTLIKFVSEISEMQHQLNEKYRIEKEFHIVKASLEEQLANSNTEKERLSEKLENEVKERNRIEEEFRAAKIWLEEQLAKRESEMELITNNLKNERQTLKQSLDNLQQQFNTLYKI